MISSSDSEHIVTELEKKQQKPENETVFPLIEQALKKANKYFIKTVGQLSFSLIICICIFVPFWVRYIQLFGLEHPLTILVEFTIVFSLQVVVLFMVSFYLFNRTHSPESALKMWSFTKEITWPWCVEGLKASVIVILGFIALFIPGIIKTIHYTFFSFVVFFNRSYKEGKINALKHSKELSKGLFWWLILFYVVYYMFHILLTWIKQSAVEFSLSHSDWVLYSTLGVYSYLLLLVCIYLFIALYFVYAERDRDQMIGTAR